MEWVVNALNANQGNATLTDICKYIWSNYKKEIQASGDGFYTWQFDVRHAVQKLRDNDTIRLADITLEGVWVLEMPK
jgi:hypothetical protein